MSDPVDDLVVSERRLDLLDAELWIVGPSDLSGRLTGPRSRYASTVEIPYYLQRIPNPEAPANARRAVIPDPSLWSPQTPFLYEAKLDLGADRGKAAFVWGFRRLALGRDGLRVNGAPFRLNGVRRATLSEADAVDLRQQGVDAVMLPATVATRAAWDVADRVGLFVVGVAEGDPAVAASLRRHASALAWIVDPRAVASPEFLRRQGAAHPFLGVMASADPAPPWAQFVVRDAEGATAPGWNGPTLALAAETASEASAELGVIRVGA